MHRGWNNEITVGNQLSPIPPTGILFFIIFKVLSHLNLVKLRWDYTKYNKYFTHTTTKQPRYQIQDTESYTEATRISLSLSSLPLGPDSEPLEIVKLYKLIILQQQSLITWCCGSTIGIYIERQSFIQLVRCKTYTILCLFQEDKNRFECLKF